MLRLLQGDVGSGKTMVALMAMLTAAEQGAQAALMALIEILAPVPCNGRTAGGSDRRLGHPDHRPGQGQKRENWCPA